MKWRLRKTHTPGFVACLFWVTVLASPPGGQAEAQGFTAQRKPRVTVLEFENTNSMAESARYGASVEAMLVTFLKSKSQFVVVERQKLGPLLDEWRRNQVGLTNIDPNDSNEEELLEKLDSIILGSVTLLDVQTQAEVSNSDDNVADAQYPDSQVVAGQRIEIDAKLLSREDGRIVAAAQRSGPVTCLRSIVERLGIALEQEYLRPFYGQLKFELSDPENVRIFLTPVLLDDALDEEKPAIERGTTVIQGRDRDIVEPWTTDPTTYTIRNILSGWYSLRLERPGYESVNSDNARWRGRARGDRIEIYDQLTKRLLNQLPPELSRFVVKVDPLHTEVLDGNARGFTFRKTGGSLKALVKRQYLDERYGSTSGLRISLVGNGLDINNFDRVAEYAADRSCDLFEEGRPNQLDYGRTHVSSSQGFDFETFKGGQIVIEDYQGEMLPSGSYDMMLWEPNYQLQRSRVNVRDRDSSKPVRVALVRNTKSLSLKPTGAVAGHKAILHGEKTGHHVELSLDPRSAEVQTTLPVDSYTVSTSVPGLRAWRRDVNLQPQNIEPPVFNPKVDGGVSMVLPQTADPAEVRLKTRLALGGELSILGSPPAATADEIHIDSQVRVLLDALFTADEQDATQSPWWDQAQVKYAGRESKRELTKRERKALRNDRLRNRLLGPIGPSVAPVQGKGRKTTQAMRENAGSGESSDDPEELRGRLAEQLEDLDLLLLSGFDMARLRVKPEVAGLIQRYVKDGGAVFAFVSDPGDYEAVLGVPFVVDEKGKRTARFQLTRGEVKHLDSWSPAGKKKGKKVSVKMKRTLPRLKSFRESRDWVVLAFGKGPKEPRVVERGELAGGGYVAVWLDNPNSFRGRAGQRVAQVEKARGIIESRVLDWSRYLMYRRYDEDGQQRRVAEKAVAP